MKRRSFLKRSSIITVPTFFGGFQLAALPSRQMSELVNGDSDRVLIIIDLNGGNDGLQTFIPLDSYDNLVNARSNIIIPQNQLLSLTDTVSVHPSMTGLKDLYDNAQLAIVQNTGYTNANRSHFRSADIWNNGIETTSNVSTGWMGRYLDDNFPGYPENYPSADCPDPFAVTMGRSVSQTCQGTGGNFSIAILDPDNVGGLSVGVEPPIPENCYGDELSYIIDTYKKTNVYGERVTTAANEGVNLYDYPNTILANQLKVVARMISGGLRSKVFILQQGGYDTHSGQVGSDPSTGSHANLLSTLSDAIFAFQEDLKLLNLAERVVGMTFSEFGRQIRSNASDGTDHGTAGPMMVFGSCVNGGIIGDNPVISNSVATQEGVPMQYDFRWVYGSILMDWFEVPEIKVRELLPPDFQYIPICNSCNLVATEDEIIASLEATVSPNPFRNFFTLDFKMDQSNTVRVDLVDVLGKKVRTVLNKSLPARAHKIHVETHQLVSGVYFIRLQIANGVKTLRLVKQ